MGNAFTRSKDDVKKFYGIIPGLTAHGTYPIVAPEDAPEDYTIVLKIIKNLCFVDLLLKDFENKIDVSAYNNLLFRASCVSSENESYKWFLSLPEEKGVRDTTKYPDRLDISLLSFVFRGRSISDIPFTETTKKQLSDKVGGFPDDVKTDDEMGNYFIENVVAQNLDLTDEVKMLCCSPNLQEGSPNYLRLKEIVEEYPSRVDLTVDGGGPMIALIMSENIDGMKLLLSLPKEMGVVLPPNTYEKCLKSNNKTVLDFLEQEGYITRSSKVSLELELLNNKLEKLILYNKTPGRDIDTIIAEMIEIVEGIISYLESQEINRD